MQSHLHNGRWSWGAKEDCKPCMKADQLMAEAREDFKVNYAPLLETTVVDADGIIRDCPHNDLRTEAGDCACGCRDIEVCSECGEEQEMAVNALIARDERPSFQPSTAELAMFLIFFFLCLGLSLHTVMKGDLAAVRADQEAR